MESQWIKKAEYGTSTSSSSARRRCSESAPVPAAPSSSLVRPGFESPYRYGDRCHSSSSCTDHHRPAGTPSSRTVDEQRSAILYGRRRDRHRGRLDARQRLGWRLQRRLELERPRFEESLLLDDLS